jgi:hypothetical protein
MHAASSLAALTGATLSVTLTKLLIPSPYDESTALAASSVTPLSLNMSAGGSKLLFERTSATKGGQRFWEITLTYVVLSSPSPPQQKLSITVELPGAEPSQTCHAVLSAQACPNLAHQLSKGIDASLALVATAPTARAAFLPGIHDPTGALAEAFNPAGNQMFLITGAPSGPDRSYVQCGESVQGILPARADAKNSPFAPAATRRSL